MDSTTIEAMHEQVRVIYRAVTGSQLNEDWGTGDAQQPLEEIEIERRFAELEALARTKPGLTSRIPPFSFTPLVDLLEGQTELLVEVAVPGVERNDVFVEVRGDELYVSGVRRGASGSNGHTLVRAEIPRGPFRSVIPLPCRTFAPRRVDVEHGLIVIELPKMEQSIPGTD